jgi:uncharacterized protein (TIGR02246 family)
MPLDLAQVHDFAARYTAAWCSQNPQRVAECFAPNGSLTINNGTPSVGRSAIAQSARSFMTDFPDLRVSMDDLRINNPRVEYHWTLSGTHAGTGAKIRIRGFESWLFSPGNLIAESIGTFDQRDYHRQIHAS